MPSAPAIPGLVSNAPCSAPWDFGIERPGHRMGGMSRFWAGIPEATSAAGSGNRAQNIAGAGAKSPPPDRLFTQHPIHTMNTAQPPTDSNLRSNLLMNRDDTALLVIDIQEKLLPLVGGHDRIVWNTGRLIGGAAALKLPVCCTEQYPAGLGPTVPGLREQLAEVVEKRMFSCRECTGMISGLRDRDIRNILLAGIETHVCVQQTALDLMSAGFNVFVAADATGSRFAIDHDVALGRMKALGATLVTTESALFEWCETSAAPEFKTISQLVRQSQ